MQDANHNGMIDWDDIPMIDFNLFPDNAITNLTLNEINDVLNSVVQHQNNDSKEEKSPNTSHIPENIRQEMDQLEEGLKSPSSSKQEKEYSKRFLEFLALKNQNIDLKTVSEEKLNDLLRWFYKELRTKKRILQPQKFEVYQIRNISILQCNLK